MTFLALRKDLIAKIETYLEEKKPIYKKEASSLLIVLKAIPDLQSFEANLNFIHAVNKSYVSIKSLQADRFVYLLEAALCVFYQIPFEMMKKIQDERSEIGRLILAVGFAPENKMVALQFKKALKNISINPIIIEKNNLNRLMMELAICKPILLNYFIEDITKLIQGYLFNSGKEVEILKSIGFYSVHDAERMKNKSLNEDSPALKLQ